MTLLLIAGPPASGKTTLAKELAERLGWAMFSKDAIKEGLFDTVGFRSREEKVALGRRAFDIMLEEASARLQNGEDVILENNFESCDVEPLGELVALTGARPLTIRLEGEPKTLYARFVARDASPERHLGHKVNDCYPPKETEKPIPVITEDAFGTGMAARGMMSFAIGELIRVDATKLPVDMDVLFERIYCFLVTSTNPGAT